MSYDWSEGNSNQEAEEGAKQLGSLDIPEGKVKLVIASVEVRKTKKDGTPYQALRSCAYEGKKAGAGVFHNLFLKHPKGSVARNISQAQALTLSGRNGMDGIPADEGEWMGCTYWGEIKYEYDDYHKKDVPNLKKIYNEPADGKIVIPIDKEEKREYFRAIRSEAYGDNDSSGKSQSKQEAKSEEVYDDDLPF